MTAISANFASSRLRTAALSVGALAAVGLGAATLQESTRRSTNASLAEAASFIDIGGRDIRLHCTGSGERTFVLEAGATGFAETWQWVQDDLDEDARVCSYDRAGLGLSDPAPGGFDSGRTAADLKTALDGAGESGPYILAGHSLGVDHFDPVMVEEFEAFPGMLRLLSAASATGLLHLWNPVAAGAQGLEGQALDAALAFAGDRNHLAASAAELEAWDDITARVRAESLPEDLPVLVVTAGSPVPGSEDISDVVEPLHQEIAGRFSAGVHVAIEEADHFSLLMNEAHAAELVDVIESFLEAVSH